MNSAHLILFMRHGDAEIPFDFYPDHDRMGLSQKGVEQAKEAAAALASLQPDQVYSSPFARAYQTAQILAGPDGPTIQIDRRLEERVFKPLYAKRYADIAEQFGIDTVVTLASGNSDHISFEGVADLGVYANSVKACLSEIGAGGRGLTVIVAHGGPHEWYLGSLFGTLTSPVRRWFELGKCRATLFRFEYGAASPARILGVNVSASDARQLIEENLLAE